MNVDPQLARDPGPPIARFGFNPSSWQQRIRICIAAAVAGVIAIYMALYQWRLVPDAWDPIFGDQTKAVLDSDVSQQMKRWFRVPDAAFGAMVFIADVFFGLAGSTRRWQYRPWLVILFGIYVILLGLVGAMLVAMQGTVVGSWCFLCMVTTAFSFLLIYWAYPEVWLTLLYLWRLWKKTHRVGAVWNAAWGHASLEVEQVAQEVIRG